MIAVSLGLSSLVATAFAPRVDQVAAAGNPDLVLTKSSPAEVLYGAEIPVTLTANAPTATIDGYNLSFNDVLPAGAGFGSSTPAPSSIIARGDGTTAVVWENVADLLVGASVSLSYTFTTDEAVYSIGDQVTNNAGAFVSDDPRQVPDFDANGANVSNTETDGSATATATTTLTPFELTKTEPNTESELLRGVHDNKTVYSLTVDNNRLLASSGFALVDYLPAGLEFLGCTGVDNSTGATEYTETAAGVPVGADRRITDTAHPTLVNCPTPTSVTTVTDPVVGASPLPSGVYTEVVWDSTALASVGASSLAANTSFTIQYAAAIPLRENVQQTLTNTTANLDNNTGALTTDEQALTNSSRVTGTTDSTVYSDDAQHTVVAEDLSIHKSVNDDVFVQGEIPQWTFDIESSEYAQSTDTVITVTDYIPNGLEYNASSIALAFGYPLTETDLGGSPTGRQIVQWDVPAFTAPNSTFSFTMDTNVLEDYRAPLTGPVAANDSWTNEVELGAGATIITDNDGSTTSAMALVDESSASQSAEEVVILKEVSDPVAGTMTCGDGAALTFNETLGYDYRPGDRVCFRLSVAFPLNLDTLDPFVKDFLPVGFDYDATSGFQYGAGHDFGAVTNGAMTRDTSVGVAYDGTGEPDGVLAWQLDNADATGLRFEVIVPAIIDPAAPLANADINANLMKFSFTNTDGSVFQRRDQADARYIEPVISVLKASDSASPATVTGGDEVVYTVTAVNSGFLAAQDAVLTDTLPSGIDCTDVTTLGTATCSNSNPDILTWTGISIPAASETPPGSPSDPPTGEVDTPGATALGYTVTIPSTFNPGRTLTNTVTVDQYLTPRNTGEPPLAFTSAATASTNVLIENSTLTKTSTTGLDTGQDGNNAATQATIGETITYTVTAVVPPGTISGNPVISDTMPTGVRLDSVTATNNGVVIPAGPEFTSSAAGFSLTLAADGTYENPSGADTIVVTVNSTVVSGVRNDDLDNAASFDWTAGALTASTRTTIVEPVLAVAKANNTGDDLVGPAEEIQYTVTVSRTGSAANEVVVTDTLPGNLTPLSGPAGTTLTDGQSVVSGGVWNEGARTITWQAPTVPSLATVNTPVALVYQAQVDDQVVGTATLTNNVAVTATSFPGANADERTSYTASTSNTVTAPMIAVESKSADVSTATVGDVVTYTVVARVPGDVVGFDLTVLDVLPNGVEYGALTSVTCAEPGPVACTPTRSGSDLNAAGDTGTIGFFVGDLGAGSPEDQVLTFVYTTRVLDDAANVTAGADLDNEARAYYNRTDKLATPATPPPANGFDATQTDPEIAQVDAVEPTLTIDKDVNGQTGDSDARRAKPGDTLTYTVSIANTGSSPAHDVTVTDTPDARLTGYTPTLPAGVTPVDADHTDGTLSWTIAGPIAPGAANAVTFSYQLTVPNTFDSADEVVGFEVVNSADISEYFGKDQTFRTANPGTFRTYGAGAYDVTADTVNVELDLASIGDRVWYDIDGDGVQDPGEPGFVGVGVTVTFVNGVGPNEIYTAVTGADGIWIVDELPGGSYTVDVDTADPDLPAGLTVSYDRDQLTTSPDGDWAGTLEEDDDLRDIDTGLTGTGSIGDLVWFDQNENGTQDGPEPGLGGVGVTLVWGGPDDDLSTLGDNVTHTTTTATTGTIGSYDFPRLPAGEYRVTVDGALPAGMAFVSDPDTGAADGIALVTLAAGVDDNAEDFGASGPYSIGDTVYLDRDGNGTQAATGEPGLEGVTVTLTYAGADGTLGGAGAADDIAFTDVTDASGNYQFDNLPPEDYRVTITGPLPAGSTNTDDPDTAAPGDSSSVLEITTASDFDQDFGYDVSSSLGDRVWWDLDRDGNQEAGEPGLNGVTITATYLGPDGVAGGGDDLVFTAITAGDGDWSITDVPDGNYTIAASGAPAGFTPTFDPDGTVSPDSTTNMTLTGSSSTQDFGYAGNSELGDSIWLDLDGDGTINGQEQGIPDVDVSITWGGPDDDVSTPGDNQTFTRTTDNVGNYTVVGLPAGEYEVTVDTATLPANLTVTYDVVNGIATPSDSVVVLLAANTARADVDFGYQGDSSIGDTIYFDRNGDGDRDISLLPDVNEPGIGGVTVQLIWGGPDGDLATTGDNDIYTTVTDDAGDYSFTGLPIGAFEVNVDESTLPGGMTNTDDEDGDLDSSTPVTLGSADDHDTADFGYTGAASIGDTIYLDLDGLGSQDTDEPGVPAQTVRLDYAGQDGLLGGLNSDDDIVLTTVTDANGNYSFVNLPDGEYTVTVVGGITANAINSGDPDAGTPNESQVTISGGFSNNAQDFGYEGDNAVGDLVWWDTDRDGSDDGVLIEPRLAGIDVRIAYAGADGLFGGANAADDVTVATVSTGAAGDYFQSGLPTGNYRIEVVSSTLPAGMDPTFDADGPVGTPDGVSLVALPGATTNSSQDFGYAGSGSIGDVVYFDRDGSGLREDIVDEPGIAGVELTLTFAGADGILGGAGAADDISIVRVAGSDGQYVFTGLPTGDYTVEVTSGLPSGALNSDDPDLPGAAPDAGDGISSITLTDGEDNEVQDFGYDVEAGLGDRVWWDFDRDGVQDPGEPGIPGITVTATYYGGDGQPDATSGGTDDEPFTTVTGPDGVWFISEIPDGNYSVELSGVPAGFENSADPDSATEPTDGFTELSGHTGINIVQDFGLAGNASIGDAIWLDLDGDGTINGDEVGLEGVTVTITWAGPDGILGGAGSADDLAVPTTTGANGDYLFEGLIAGDYSVSVDMSTLPVGLDPSYDRDGTTVTPDGTTSVTLAATDVVDDADFGFRGTSSIGDTIFFDRNRDGNQDVGGNGDEPGLAGVSVTLTWAGETGTIGDADDHVFTTVTDTDGAYSFDGLPAGEYEVDVVTTALGGLPVGVDNTVDEDGNQNSSTPVTLAVGDDHDTADFGYAGIASIGDTIFVDLDGDGTQGADEPGVAGQTVTLTGAEGTFTTVTDANGNYSFDNLPDGDYTVSVVGGVVDAANNTADPDGPVGTGDSVAAVTIAGGASNDTLDFGYQGTAALGDTIYFDVDNDGVDDGAAAEPRLGGVDVVVTWLGPDGVASGGDDIVLPVTPTDADGLYNVTGLPAGTYTVAPDVSDVPSGLIPTADSDADGDATSTVTVVAGETDLDQDFAFTGSGSIAGNVWLDGDDDTAFGNDEPGIEGAIVTVTWFGSDGVPGGGDDVVYTTTAADDGSWSVDDLPAGEYSVEVGNLPDGVSGPTTTTVTLAAGEDVAQENFPFIGSASVGDTVFLDVDGDGVQGTNEPGLDGVTVTVTSAGVDGALGTDDDLVVTVVTADDGTYTVPGLPIGPTTVALDPATLSPGLVPTGDADGGNASTSQVDLTAGETNVDQDFAVSGTSDIRGRIIDEDDGSGIGGVTVTISYEGPDGPVVFTIVTDDDGGFAATDLPEGDYTVEIRAEDQPTGYIPTGPTSIDVSVVNGEPVEPVEFPFARPATIGDRVYVDGNRNGVQDANEFGVAGVTVTLLDDAGSVVASVLTNADGIYLFESLEPGTYTVVLDRDTLPSGLTLTVDPDGTLDGRHTVTVGPGDDVRSVDFGVAAQSLPATGSGLGALLRTAGLLLAMGLILLALRRRRRPIGSMLTGG